METVYTFYFIIIIFFRNSLFDILVEVHLASDDSFFNF